MTSVSGRERPKPLTHEYQPLPAFLSYLVPGLGQIYQGRVAKGILFFVCVLTLFYYGMYLGSWSNVYLPHSEKENNPWNLRAPLVDFYNRPQFLAQFWVGIATWPSVVQYAAYDEYAETGLLFGSYQRTPYENRSATSGGETPAERKQARKGVKQNEALADWRGKTINELQMEGDKGWDLGWVFTVIAGVLNLMVIYDALAGPAFVVVPEGTKEAKV